MSWFKRLITWLIAQLSKIAEAPVAAKPPPIENVSPVKSPVEGAVTASRLVMHAPPDHLPPYGQKTFGELAPRYAYLYASATLKNRERIGYCIDRLLRNRSRYEAVEAKTGVPWYFVGCIHCLEASFNFKSYLGNGDPLDAVTKHVPQGRGPFASWEAGAIDALSYEGLVGKKAWTLELILFYAERYNGMGYYSRGINSPYLWSCTQHHSRGKYVADHVFDPNKIDDQVGVAAMLKRLEEIGLLEVKIDREIPMAFV